MKMMKSFAIILIIVLIINLVIIETTTGETSVQSRNESERITGWMISTVEDWGKISGESSLALDSNNVPHVSYYDYDNDVLWYAFWNGERWERNNIDDGGPGELDNFITVDSENVPHISYSSHNSLKYAKKNGTSWETEIVDSNGFTGRENSLALDSKNHPHISYFENHDDDLKYARWNGSTWSIETVDSFGHVGYANSLALDSNDHPHIIYNDLTNDTLKYATWNGSTWSIETVDNHSVSRFSRSIDIDSFDYPHICYYDWLNKSLKYARWDGTDWITNTVVNDTVYEGSFILDKHDCPSIVYSTFFQTASNDQNLTYAKWNGDSWNIQLIKIYTRLSGISMDLDKNGDPHIGYIDESPNYDMKYAWLVRNPTPPRNLTSDHGDGFVRLSWDSPLEDGNLTILKYYIYRGEKSGREVLIDNVTYPNTWYIDPSVINGQKYYYYITAVNFVGESKASIIISSIPMGVPSYPLNVKVRSGGGFVILSWDEPFDDGGSDIIEYRIFRGDQYDNESYLDKVPSDERSFNDTSVINGRKYFYFITAVNSVGIGERSESVSSTPFGLPSAPRNVHALSGNGFVEISWEEPVDDGGSEISEYLIDRVYPNGKMVIRSVKMSSRSYNDTTVINGCSYTYYVSAVTPIGEGEFSSDVVGEPSSIPSPPLNVRLIAGDGFINILWDEPSDDGGLDIIEYRIFKGSSPEDVEWIKTLSGSIYRYNDTDVENGIKYFYHIIAENSRGESEASIDVWDIPLGCPSPPLNISVVEGDGFIRISWDKPLNNGGSNIIRYIVYRGLTSEDLSILDTTDQFSLTYNDTSVISGETYCYQISAGTYHREGKRSSEIFVTLKKEIYPPSAPSNITILSFENDVIISWNHISSNDEKDILEYRIYRGSTKYESEYITTVNSSITRYTDHDLQIGHTYYYSITAVNIAGESEKSISVNITIPDSNSVNGSSYLFLVGFALVGLSFLIVVIGSIILITIKHKGITRMEEKQEEMVDVKYTQNENPLKVNHL